ncbi:MAG TPA: hypothetical protein VMO26_04155 [Vicinamibacterales bacterium]|nr:hypothetical protein [Vicinamibacterales bacterium]
MRLKSTLVAVLWMLNASAASAQTTAPLYRVFLADGSALASFGEWARVEDRVVFSMPTAPGAGPGELHLVSLPVQRVDLGRTERYADAVRAEQYAATRGEADFAQLSSTVAKTLNQVASFQDPRQRLEAAERARRALADWPARHHNYRAAEVREIIGVLDGVITSLRASAGLGAFDLAFSTSTVAPPSEPLMAAPTHEEVVQQLITASKVVDSPVEKVSLLQSVVALIDRAVAYLPAAVAAAIRSSALAEITDEERIDQAYADLRTTALADAARFAERADVRSLERVRQLVHAHDAKLGARRPDTMAGVLATLATHLDAAHRLRLAHDQWLLSEGRMRTYRRAALPHIQALIDRKSSLDDIKLLAGPAPQRLRTLARDLERNRRLLALLDPPPMLAAVHAALRSAYTLAEHAVQLRRAAVEIADVDIARQASAAASGALMLLERARAELRTALQPPLTLKASARP